MINDGAGAIPERLGRYEIVERLSAGGMGEVFVARFVAPGGFVKPVALKRIHPHLAGNEQFIQMLHDEANVTASLRHPNIVATVDVGSEGNDHFVVLDYVSGDPLSRLVREMKQRGITMPAFAVAFIGVEIASALHAAHECRTLHGEALEIVHRDVSLGNVMLSDAGHAMLFDFGVAKASQKIHQTAHGELKGKLTYMAPEIFRGAPVNRTVDVFSLGVVLYELLTNVSPFHRDSDIEIITALQSAEVPPPSAIVPALDPGLDRVVMRAMARDRAKRYATAAEVEADLRGWARAAGVSLDAGPVAAWYGATFPHRVQARRAVLARVADRTQRPQLRGAPGAQNLGNSAASWPGASAQTPGPGSWPGAASSPGSWPGAASRQSVPHPGAVFPMTPGPMTPGHVERPPSVSNLSVGVTSASGLQAVGAPPSRAPWIAVAGAAIVACVVLAVLLVRAVAPGSTVAEASGSTVGSASAAPALAAPFPPSASASASAIESAAAPVPTATAKASASAARPVPAHPGPAKAPDGAVKGKGPIVRSYD